MEYKKRGSSPKTRKKYLDCLNDIQFQLSVNESVCLTDIVKKHQVSNFVVTVLKKIRVIQQTVNGHRWISREPMGGVLENVLWTISEHNKQKSLYRRSIGIEKENAPVENYSEAVFNLDHATNKYVQDQPEAIFTFDPLPERAEVKNHVQEQKTFEISMFGISLFKIKR